MAQSLAHEYTLDPKIFRNWLVGSRVLAMKMGNGQVGEFCKGLDLRRGGFVTSGLPRQVLTHTKKTRRVAMLITDP